MNLLAKAEGLCFINHNKMSGQSVFCTGGIQYKMPKLVASKAILEKPNPNPKPLIQTLFLRTYFQRSFGLHFFLGGIRGDFLYPKLV